jgi:hypothetical protein
MANIINEMPDDELDVTMEGDELEVDLDAGRKKAQGTKSTADVERVVQSSKQEELFEVEEEDDTPPEDRGKEPLPDDIVEQLENDTLEDYSDRVKQRMAQLKKVWHDERRAKEQAAREKEEAISYAQKIANENKKLKTSLSTGEEQYISTVREKYESDLAVAKRDYREAYDSGDTDAIIDAQGRMNDAQYKLSHAQNLKPQYETTSQTQETSVEYNQPQQRNPNPDPRAQKWQAKNQWFGRDEEMTSLALGVHERLVRSGIDPTSDDYYRRIDETMQKRFPENFGETSLEPEKPSQRKPSNVVAPASRSTAPRKVRLSKTQVAFAKKLKLTPEQYAREMIKLENANG